MGRGMPLPFGTRAPRHIAACVALFAALGARRSAAAELPGARLEVSRSEGAGACPDAEQLATELSRRMGPRNSPDSELLLLSVELGGDTEAYVAKVRVDGRKHGERTLRAAGPTCDSLRDALLVTLLVLLDEERAAAPGDAPTTAPAEAASAADAAPAGTPESTLTTAPAAPATEPRATVPEARSAQGERQPQPATLWLALGGGVTHGIPQDWSGALLLDLSVRVLGEAPSVRDEHSPPTGASIAVFDGVGTQRSGANREADTARAEARLVGVAREALQRGDAGRALSVLEDAQRRFPNGILLQEREALSISALAALGRKTEAAARAGAFLRVFPNSPHADRVRAAEQTR